MYISTVTVIIINNSDSDVWYMYAHSTYNTYTIKDWISILNQTVKSIQEHSNLLNIVTDSPKGSTTNPAISCSETPTDRPPGEYWIVRNSSTEPVVTLLDGG